MHTHQRFQNLGGTRATATRVHFDFGAYLGVIGNCADACVLRSSAGDVASPGAAARAGLSGSAAGGCCGGSVCCGREFRGQVIAHLLASSASPGRTRPAGRGRSGRVRRGRDRVARSTEAAASPAPACLIQAATPTSTPNPWLCASAGLALARQVLSERDRRGWRSLLQPRSKTRKRGLRTKLH